MFGGSTLNKVIDRELAVSQFRSLEGLRGRLARSRAILDVYTARLPPGVLTDELTTALDGGNLLSDGRGSCFLTEIVLDKNEGDAARIHRDLRDRAGCARAGPARHAAEHHERLQRRPPRQPPPPDARPTSPTAGSRPSIRNSGLRTGTNA